MRKRRKIEKEKEALGDASVEVAVNRDKDKERPLSVDEIEVDEQKMHEEMRILIKVCDQFCLCLMLWRRAKLTVG
jgi:hypothetical protein